ncbi:hypothetical protein, partial [Streptomyces katsurahamanus]
MESNPTRGAAVRGLLAGALALGGVTALVAPASAADSARAGQRGSVVSVEKRATIDAAGVIAALGDTVDAGAVRYGVTPYVVTYRTTDHTGTPTTASQLVVLPESGDRTLSTVSWLHGTIVYKGDVATVRTDTNDYRAALLFASTGRAVSAPDYIGLGRNSPGVHPYGDPRATVSASVDALRSARSVVHGEGRELEREVQISGFSQGGPAAMTVGRALQREGADPYFRLGALAPVGGPFDLSAFEAAAADDRIDKSAIYLAYFVTAWNRMYGGLYDSPGDAFKSPYDATVEGLFDGNHTQRQILEGLPQASRDLFTPEFLERIRHPEGVLKDRLRALDTTCDWQPQAPVRIFHGRGDKDVAFAHAEHCTAQLKANGAKPRLVDVGPYDHNSSVR